MRSLASVAALSLLASTIGAAQSPAPPGAGTGLIVGQVVDGDSGRPVGGAVVMLGSGPVSSGPTRVVATSEGRFVFRDLPAGRISLAATKTGYAEGVYGRRRPNGPGQPLTLGDGERLGDVVIRIWKLSVISGTVVDEAGEPLVNVGVRAFRKTAAPGPRFFTIAGSGATDDRGVYRIASLLPGEYVVAVVSRHVSLPLSLAIGPQGGGRAIAGDVPELIGVALLRPGPAGSLQIGDVAFSLGGGTPVPPPPAGDRLFVYPTTFYPSATSSAQATIVTVSSGEERSAFDFQLRPLPAARVSGTVSGPEGPMMTPLRLVPSDAGEVGLEQEALSTVSDRLGSFLFPAVPAGQYSLRAGTRPRGPQRPGDAQGTLWADMPIAVGSDDIAGVTVTVQPGLRISGRFEFEGAAERPTAQRLQQTPIVIEAATPNSGEMANSPPARVDANGQFTSAGLPPGKYFVRIGGSPTGWRFKSATSDGRDVADVPLDLRSDASVVITFSDRWTSVRGTVVSPRGVPDPDALVLLFPADAQLWTYSGLNGRRFKNSRTSRTGEYGFTSVPEGDYYVVAIPDDQAAGWQDTKFLEALARVAARVNVGDNEAKAQDLRTQEVR